MTCEPTGIVFDIADLATQDGPGIRSVIFLKGCPLRCLWCSNPESHHPYPELLRRVDACVQCGNCERACPGIVRHEGSISVDFFRCAHCPDPVCLLHCSANALRISGRLYTVGELMRKLEANRVYYRNSGGGITFSGGEPFQQAEFMREITTRAVKSGISVGVETCGYFDWKRVADIVPDLDFIYFDLKVLDENRHREVTGQSLTPILDNLRRLCEVDSSKIIVSLPIIPGVNDNTTHIDSVTALCRELALTRVRLLPYHALGKGKYSELGRDYPMPQPLALAPETIPEFAAKLSAAGLEVVIEGF